jgi:hypothetical protein
MSGLSDDISNRQIVRNKTLLISGSLEEEGSTTSSVEQLSFFNVQLRDSNGTVYFNSDKIYTGENLNPNTLNYVLNLDNLNLTKTDYTIRINYTTKHSYTNFKDFYISLAESQSYSNFSPSITVEANEDDGLITLKVKNSITDSHNCNLRIKRASS